MLIPSSLAAISGFTQIVSHIDSITNPISGKISAHSIGEMIIDDQIIDPSQTKIQLKEM